MGFMAGKKALIVGVASERSIAAGIAEAFAREGCEIAFTYQNEKLLSRVQKLSARLGQDTDLLFPCDVTSDEEIDAVFKASARSGMVSIFSYIPSALRRVNSSPVVLLSRSPGKALPFRTISRPIASPRLPKPACP